MDLTGWIAERYELTNRLGNWAAHGVQPALEGLTVEMANWRPADGQHTIAEMIAHLAEALAELQPDRLLDALMGSWLSPKRVTRTIDLAVDIATHDLYHAGQIFVLKRLYAARG